MHNSIFDLSMFTGMAIYFFVRTALVALALMWMLHKTEFGRKRRVYHIAHREGQVAVELKTACMILLFDAVGLTLLQPWKVGHFVESNLFTFSTSFWIFFLWSEIYFYFAHRLIHHPKLFFIHAHHHRARVVSPFTNFSYSLGERFIMGAGALSLPLVLSHYIPMATSGMLAYAFFNLTANTLGHSNVEVYPPGFSDRAWTKWISTPTNHSLHHSKVRGNYTLYLTCLDVWFGTRFSDSSTLQSEAAQGEGRRSFTADYSNTAG